MVGGAILLVVVRQRLRPPDRLGPDPPSFGQRLKAPWGLGGIAARPSAPTTWGATSTPASSTGADLARAGDGGALATAVGVRWASWPAPRRALDDLVMRLADVQLTFR